MNATWVKRAIELFFLPSQPSASTVAGRLRMEGHVDATDAQVRRAVRRENLARLPKTTLCQTRMVKGSSVSLMGRLYSAPELETFDGCEVQVHYMLHTDAVVTICTGSPPRFVCQAAPVEKRNWASASRIEEQMRTEHQNLRKIDLVAKLEAPGERSGLDLGYEPRGGLTDVCVLDRKVHCEISGQTFRPWLWIEVDRTSGTVLAWQILSSEISAVRLSGPALPRAIYGRVERQLRQFNQLALALPGEPPSLTALAAAAREFFGVDRAQG